MYNFPLVQQECNANCGITIDAALICVLVYDHELSLVEGSVINRSARFS